MNMSQIEAEIFDFFGKQNYAECIKTIDSAPEIVQQQSRFKILKTSCITSISGSRFAEVHEILDRVLRDEPNNSFAHYSKGMAFFNNGKLRDSLASFELALTSDGGESMEMEIVKTMKARATKMLRVSSGDDDDSDEDHHEDESNECDFQPAFSQNPFSSEQFTIAADEDNNKEQQQQQQDKQLPTCEECGKSFAKQYNLQRHILIHSKVRSFKCTMCDYICNQKYNLERHLAAHHNIEGERSHKCQFCSKSFKTNRLLLFHERSHTNHSPFCCELCNETITDKRQILEHMKNVHADVDQGQLMEMMMTTFMDHNTSNDDSFKMPAKLANEKRSQEEETEKKFLISVLPDISRMDNKQKRSFKRQIIELIDRTLDN